MNSMTKHDIAIIGIKLLAIYVLLQVIDTIPTWTITLSMFTADTPASIQYPILFKFIIVLFPILFAIAPILLWVFSERIAGFMIKTSRQPIEKESSPHDIQSILFCSVGIFIFIMATPELVIWVYGFLQTYMRSDVFPLIDRFQFAGLIKPLLTMLLSIILIFTSKRLSTLLYKLRSAGSSY